MKDKALSKKWRETPDGRKRRYKTAAEKYMQLRISRTSALGRQTIVNMRSVSASSGLSLNHLAELALAAGMPTVAVNVREIEEAAMEPA